jgi:tRNA (guanine26-N2/guanine27-N2)-dimethyltransferase
VETAQRNVESLGFGDRAEVIHGDAKVLLLTESKGKRFDFVDVDPFGTPAPYVSAAVQSISPKGGLLAVTATDMPVLCGVYPKISLRRYGGFSTRAPFTHEIAVRLLNGFIYSVAGSNDCSMEPLAVLSTDHYVRTWVRIETNRTESNRQAGDLGLIRYCTGCMHTEVFPLAPKVQDADFNHKMQGCNGPIRIAGPLWIGDLFNDEYLNNATSILKDGDVSGFHKKAPEVLEKMVEESALTNNPFIDLHALYDLHNLAPVKNQVVIDGLKEQGYEATRTHFRPTAIRTDASVEEVTKIVTDHSAR